MKRHFLVNLAASLALAAVLMPLAGQAGDSKAQIVTGTEKAADCISAVHVNKIDGREVKVQKLGFEIEPGTHTLSGRALVNTSFCKAMGQGTSRSYMDPLEADFEAGKTYYLGYDHSSPHRKDWKLVIWKVEDANS